MFPFPKIDNDIVGGQGVTDRTFQLPGGKDSKGADTCQDVAYPLYFIHAGNKNIDTRRVTGRNTPSVINAVYNFRNFWDGRAQDDFNGVNPFGMRDVDASNPDKSGLFKDVNGKLQGITVHLTLSSLASQAVGPPNNDVEMSCAGRIFPDLGRKLLALKPLGQQKVSKQDSVLGPLVKADEDGGLQTSYEALIKKAFKPELWQNTKDLKKLGPDSPVVKRQLTDKNERVDDDKKVRKETADEERKHKVVIPSNQYREMELNFSLFWGLAIQMYESTLVADQTPVDRFLAGDASALNADQQAGLALFEDKGKCSACHGGAATTNASVFNVINERLERMHMGDDGIAVYDNGFYNTGVRATNEDHGVGGTDPFGNPLSEVGFCQAFIQKHPGESCPIRNLQQNGQVQNTSIADTIQPRPDENIPTTQALQPKERINADGSFKTPQMRNVELTGPYMHNGGQLTLRQVVDFYNRGGDFRQENQANLDPNIEPLGLTDKEEDQLVQFLVALTDERVRFEAAPFDHPSICVPEGFKTNGNGTLKLSDSGTRPQDDNQCIAAVGAGGRSFEHRLQPFLKADPRK